MATPLRVDLLRSVSAFLPDVQAQVIWSMDPMDVNTHLRAYLYVRRHRVALPGDLRSDLVESIVASMDAAVAGTR